MTFLDELRRRNVLRIAGLYLVGAWLIVQVASTVLPAFNLPGWVLRAVITVLAIGFIPALVFAWAFELTPEGLKRETDVDRAGSITSHTGKGLDRIIMVVLALALGYFTFDKFVLSPRREAAQVSAAHKEGRSEALVESFGDKSIAVLPFVDMSAGKDQEYFADGISEELLNLLAKVPQLRVISRSSAFSYKGKDVQLAQVAEELNVEHILEGSVRKAGNRVRITAQLIDARSDTHLWSETYDRTMNDIFAVQDEIAAAVVEQLKLKLLGAPPKAQTTDPEAFALLMQARHFIRQGTDEGRERALASYQQTLAIDPGHAAAWSGIAAVYLMQGLADERRLNEAYVLARAAVDKALALDPDCADAYWVLGNMALAEHHDLATAAGHFTRALALDPASSDILRSAAYLARNLGRYEEAIAIGKHATARDPVSPAAHMFLGFVYEGAGRYDDAIESMRTALLLSPDRAGAHAEIGYSLLLKGEKEGALAEMKLEPDESSRLFGLAIAQYALGHRAESDAALRELTDKIGQDDPYGVAWVFAFRGEADRAFVWLEKAVQSSAPGLYGMVGNRLLDNLHDDPRWLPFLRRVGVAPEQLEAIEFDVTLPQ